MCNRDSSCVALAARCTDRSLRKEPISAVHSFFLRSASLSRASTHIVGATIYSQSRAQLAATKVRPRHGEATGVLV